MEKLFDVAFFLFFFFFLNPGHAISTQVLQQEFGVTRGTVLLLSFFFPWGDTPDFARRCLLLAGSQYCSC